jgi:hypothetical protein
LGFFSEAAMGLAHSAVAFDHTVTTTFGKGLALWSAVAAVRSQTFGLVGCGRDRFRRQGLALWGAIVAVFEARV